MRRAQERPWFNQVAARYVPDLVGDDANEFAGAFCQFDQPGIDENIRAARDESIDVRALDQDDFNAAGVEICSPEDRVGPFL